MPGVPFHFHYSLGLHDTDAAGVLFSANLTRICHQAYEAMMKNIGYGLPRLFRERPFGLPLAHIEGDFFAPLRCGDDVDIVTRVTELGSSSYRVEFALMTANEKTAAKAATVHVCVELKTYRPLELPDDFRQALGKHFVPNGV
ncbi:acyl-CoA thioesterase [candidate division KSB1 bacterium]|nr:acyl-CoA thioesterase [candidate division KSB1 bacterium]